MVRDLSSIEMVWVVIGEAGIDEPEWLVCFTTNERDAVRAVEVCARDADSLAPEERDTAMDGYAKDVRPELAPIIASRRAKLTLDLGYRGGADGATYRYEMIQRWPPVD